MAQILIRLVICHAESQTPTFNNTLNAQMKKELQETSSYDAIDVSSQMSEQRIQSNGDICIQVTLGELKA